MLPGLAAGVGLRDRRAAEVLGRAPGLLRERREVLALLDRHRRRPVVERGLWLTPRVAGAVLRRVLEQLVVELERLLGPGLVERDVLAAVGVEVLRLGGDHQAVHHLVGREVLAGRERDAVAVAAGQLARRVGQLAPRLRFGRDPGLAEQVVAVPEHLDHAEQRHGQVVVAVLVAVRGGRDEVVLGVELLDEVVDGLHDPGLLHVRREVGDREQQVRLLLALRRRRQLAVDLVPVLDLLLDLDVRVRAVEAVDDLLEALHPVGRLLHVPQHELDLAVRRSRVRARAATAGRDHGGEHRRRDQSGPDSPAHVMPPVVVRAAGRPAAARPAIFSPPVAPPAPHAAGSDRRGRSRRRTRRARRPRSCGAGAAAPPCSAGSLQQPRLRRIRGARLDRLLATVQRQPVALCERVVERALERPIEQPGRELRRDVAVLERHRNVVGGAQAVEAVHRLAGLEPELAGQHGGRRRRVLGDLACSRAQPARRACRC